MRIYSRILKGKDHDEEFGTSYEPTALAPAQLESKEYVPDEFDVAPSNKSIEEDFGDTIADYMIVRDEGGSANCFWVFDNPTQIYQTVSKRLKSWHEVCLPGVPRKLYFDFDFSEEHFQSLFERTNPHHLVFTDLLQAPEQLAKLNLPAAFKADILQNFSSDAIAAGGFSQFINPDNNYHQLLGRCLVRHFLRFLAEAFRDCYLLLCESCTTASKKFSAHVIVGAFADHYYDVAEYASLLYERFAAQDAVANLAAQFIDMAVYKSIQNFRITGCIKRQTQRDRTKVLINNPWGSAELGWRHTLLTYIDGETDLQLAPRFTSRLLKNERLHVTSPEGLIGQESLPTNFMEILGSLGAGFKVAKVIDNLVTFVRVGETPPCAICRRSHTADNNLMVLVSRVNYIVLCRRDPAHRKIILTVTSNLKTVTPSASQGGTRSQRLKRVDTLVQR